MCRRCFFVVVVFAPAVVVCRCQVGPICHAKFDENISRIKNSCPPHAYQSHLKFVGTQPQSQQHQHQNATVTRAIKQHQHCSTRPIVEPRLVAEFPPPLR